jgi:lipopolysaccharide export system protein LptA
VVVVGLLLFCGGFTLYSQLFGWIDGLPPLPAKYLQARPIDGPEPTSRGGVKPIIARLRAAFGDDCIEQTYNMKFEARAKGIIFAAADSEIMTDGRVRLDQVSVVIFGKNNSKEITTVHADRAFLTFDQPVRKIEDMGSRKVTAAELHSDPEFPTNDPRKGNVYLTNNRKTPDPNDDLILKTAGPIFYVDEPKLGEPHIWSFAHLELTDRQNRPNPSQLDGEWQLPTVSADGMRVYLSSEPPQAPGAPRRAEKKPSGSISGVERLELDRNVVMNLWSESRMLGGDAPKNPPPKKADTPAPEKSLIIIQTNGPFSYDMPKDFAHFELPPLRDAGVQEYVKVTRKNKGHSEDTLTSDFLDVQFMRRKPAAGQASATPSPKAATPPASEAASSPESEMEIDTVHAWGKSIALSSDGDSLYAFGHDLVHDAKIKQTVMKGSPMNAVKDGNLIRAPEIVMTNVDDKSKQHVRARGPGLIGMGDMDPKTQEHSRQAHWNDWLTMVRVKEHGKDLDLVTLTGGSAFMDTVNKQRLNARQIKLWLLPRDDKPDPKKPAPKMVAKAEPKKAAAGPKTDEGKQPLPHRLEATGEVVAFSPDLIVRQSDYLNAWFKDVPLTVPDPKIQGRDGPIGAGPLPNPKMDAKVDGGPNVAAGPKSGVPPKKESPKTPEKKDPPIELRHARRIETWVNRSDGKNELDKLHTQGNVIVHQDPTEENERGTDIAGDTVDVQRFLEGNVMTVTGNNLITGEVHFDKVSIIADDINIDQRDNTAKVNGPGSMRLLSQTSLTDPSKPLEKPTWIDIFWNDSMDLNGPFQSVHYEGNVTAKQNDGKVLCETMQVWLDRPIYLNQADRAKEPPPKKGEPKSSPKVEKVLCDQQPNEKPGVRPKRLLPVTIEDQEKEGGKLVKYQFVQGQQIQMDNLQNLMIASGPGFVRVWQPGSKDPLGDPKDGRNPKDMPKAKDGKKPKEKEKDKGADAEEMKLTWVAFEKHMMGFNNLPKRAIFRDTVELVHMAASKHDVPINIAKLPEGALYLKCYQQLEVTTQTRKIRGKDGKETEVKWQEMVAQGNVRVRSDDFDGWAGTVTYTEEKSLLVFIGTKNNPATLQRAEIKGGERKRFSGMKITYNVKTKDMSIEESTGGSSN